MSEPNWDAYENFNRDEFVCHCGCDRADTAPEFMRRLQDWRTELGHPIIISSGYRCPPNDPSGRHRTGYVADITISGQWAWALVQLMVRDKVRSLGIRQHGPHGKRFIHADDSSEPSFLWTYDAPAPDVGTEV